MKQRDLFPPRRSAPEPPRSAPEQIEPFDDWDLSCLVPRPEWVIPPELALPIDDETWMPGKA